MKNLVKMEMFNQKFLAFILVVVGWSQFVLAQTGTLVTTVEAESGVLAGSVVKSTSMAGYTGTGYVTNFLDTADKVTVTVNVPATAFYSIYIRYHSEYKKQYVSVNSNGASEVEFLNTSTSWGTVNAGKYVLNAGDNTLTVQKSWGWCDIDQFKIYTTTLNSYNNVTTALNDTTATVATQSLYNFLFSQYRKRIISGQTDGAYYDTIKSISGKSPMIRTWDFSHYTEGYPYLWKNGGYSFGIDTNDKSTENAINWYKNSGRKGIVGFHWHWHSPSGGKVGKNNFYTAETTFDITKAVQPGTTEYNLIIRDIDAIAAQLKKLQAQNVPVMWRPLHEAGGGWFWWGAKGPVACKQLYAILYDRIARYHKINNLIWIWSTPETDWYPGNSTVDMVGHDSYPGDYNYGSQKVAFDAYFNLANGTKIVAMSENGPIPNIDESLDLDAPWSYFMSWSDLVKSQNSRQHIKDVMLNNRVLTLENDTFPMINAVTHNAVCDSGTMVLGATATFGSVKWYAVPTGDTAIFTGNSFTTPKLYATTTYYVEASYNNRPSEIKRMPVKANIVKHVLDTLTITGSQEICKGTALVTYTAPVKSNIDTYIWTIPTGATGSSTTNMINVTYGSNSQSGNIILKGHNICGDGPADTLAIIVNNTPVTPVITIMGDTLTSNSPIGNQWYFNSNAISYATSDTCRVTKSGNYYVIVSSNGCSSLPSNTIAAVPTGIDFPAATDQISIFPNPTSGIVKIVLQNKLIASGNIAVYDFAGSLLQTSVIKKGQSEFTVDLSNYSVGVYVLKLHSAEKQYQFKIMRK